MVQDEYEIGQAVLRYEGIQKTRRNHLPIESQLQGKDEENNTEHVYESFSRIIIGMSF